MHRILHAAITPLVALATSVAAKALDVPAHPLLTTDKGLTYRAGCRRISNTAITMCH
jgi:hypothetical protein